MNYAEALEFLFSSLPMYQRVGKVAYKSNLDNTLELDEYFEHPHRSFATVHIAGTNGKGSVAHMLAAVMQSAGYRTGLYTSPHMKDFRERIRINGEKIPEPQVTGFVNRHQEIIRKVSPSFFEMTVAMSFDYFRQNGVDIAVVETGMGGRLDSTNIVTPVLSLITNIGMDHSQFLGDTLYKIAGEKAGIIKKGVPVVVGQTQEEIKVVFERKCRESGSSLYFADREYRVVLSLASLNNTQIMQLEKNGRPYLDSLELDLMGMYQQKNIVSCIKAIDLLVEAGWKLDEDHIRRGVAAVRELTGLRGRWEILGANPLVVADTAHNRDGIREILQQIRGMAWKDLHIVFGMVDDKDPGPILSQLPGKARYYFTQSSLPRAMDREKLARKALEHGLYGKICPSPARALEIARESAGPEDLIFVGGSTFVVAEVLD